MKPTALLNVALGREATAAKFADGRLPNVHVLGFKSKNNRDYTREAVQAAVPLYERLKVYADHKEERSVNDIVGYIESARYDAATGIRGDLVLNQGHPMYESYAWLATSAPDVFGISHSAGIVMAKDGRTVTRIATVESADLVANPATVNGLFESCAVTESVSDRKKLVDMTKWATHDVAHQAHVPLETLQEASDMDLTALTLADLTAGRPDLITAIESAAVKPAVTAALARESVVQKALAKLPAVLRTATIEKIVRATEGAEIDALVADLSKTVKATEAVDESEDEEVVTGSRESADESEVEVAATEKSKPKALDVDGLLALYALR